jgi:hypothetical protein
MWCNAMEKLRTPNQKENKIVILVEIEPYTKIHFKLKFVSRTHII